MPAAPVLQSQITRAVKAVKAAGVPVGRIEVAPDGTVKVFAGDELIDTDERALDDWVRKNARED